LCTAPGRVIKGHFPSEIDGPERDYRIYLPPCYGEDDRTYPTLYLFHGGAHSDDHWDNLGIDETAGEMINEGTIPPMLIVMPYGGELANNSSGGNKSFEGLFVNELLPYIESTYCAWPEPDGRAVGGISRGGYWALEIAFRQPDQFRSAGGHSAALLDTDADSDMNPQETGLSNDLGDLRIYLDIGDQDWLINEISQLHDDMSLEGVPHVWHLNEGGHTDDYWSTNLGDYLDWYGQPWPAERDAYPICIRESIAPGQG
jgi:enterochelin esterase-like enzyme